MTKINLNPHLDSSKKFFKTAFQDDHPFSEQSVTWWPIQSTEKAHSIYRAQFPNFTPDRRYPMSYLSKVFNFTNSSTSKNKRLDRESTTSCRLGASLEKPGATLRGARTHQGSGTYFPFLHLVKKAIIKASSLSAKSQFGRANV